MKGKVTSKGAPLKVGEKGQVQVIFIPSDDSKGNKYTGQVNPDGTFTLSAADGKGIPKGKYKVAVHQWDPYPKKDLLKGQYGPDKTTIVREVASDEKPLEIDLGNPGG